MIIDTQIEKEYVEGGVNVTTTTIEFISTDILNSRVILADQELADLQTKKQELDVDISSAKPIAEPVDTLPMDAEIQ